MGSNENLYFKHIKPMQYLVLNEMQIFAVEILREME